MGIFTEKDDLSLAIERIYELETGIRKVKDDWIRGDDKCWKDLVILFKLLPEGFILPVTDTKVELSFCEQYIRSCHHPDVKYTSPQRRIEELETENKRLSDIVQYRNRVDGEQCG